MPRGVPPRQLVDIGSWKRPLGQRGERRAGQRNAGDLHGTAISNSCIYSTHRMVVGIGLKTSGLSRTPDARW